MSEPVQDRPSVAHEIQRIDGIGAFSYITCTCGWRSDPYGPQGDVVAAYVCHKEAEQSEFARAPSADHPDGPVAEHARVGTIRQALVGPHHDLARSDPDFVVAVDTIAQAMARAVDAMAEDRTRERPG